MTSGTKTSPPHITNDRLPRNVVVIIAVLLVSSFTVILNETILNVALSRLMTALNVSESTVQWLATGFLLTMAVVIPTTGFILERLSTRTVFFLAMGLFTAGTTIAAAAPNFEILLLARVVQASGTAIMLPLLMTTILTLVPVSRRGAVMGNITIAISMAPALGPTVSGFILSHFEWRFIFILVIPVALIALVLGAIFLTNVGEAGHQRLDFLSVILTIPAFGGLVYGLSQIGGHGGESAHDAGASNPLIAPLALVVGVLFLGLFTWRQLRLQQDRSPLLDLRAFRYPMFTASVLTMLVAMMALFGAVILVPLYLQNVLHQDPLVTGLVLLPGGLIMGLSGPFVGRLFDRIGPRPLMLAGSILMVLSLWLLSTLNTNTAVWLVAVVMSVLNLALSLIFTPAFTNGLNPLPPSLYSHGSAIMTTLQQVAGAAGTALLVAISAGVAASSGSLMTGLRVAFLTAAAVAIAAVVLSLFMKKAEAPEGQLAPAVH